MMSSFKAISASTHGCVAELALPVSHLQFGVKLAIDRGFDSG
jgi:hypothetical protein